MSEVLERFKEAARRKEWKAAYEYCNGLNMYEMLRGLDSLGSALLNDMRAQMATLSVWGGPNMPRIKYAMDVVQLGKLPTDAVGDLKATGQVQDASNFLAAQKPAAPSGSASREVKADVMKAVREGRVQGVTGQLTSVVNNGHFNDGKHTTILADAMYFALAALSTSNMISIMSMIRYEEGKEGNPHARIREDGTAVCSAMDIQAYAGFPIKLINGENVDNTIAGVVKVIDNLPPGEFALGLTRPSPFPGGPEIPDKDVFLPCNTKAGWPKYKVGSPRNNPTPQFRNPEAAEKVNAALGRNPRATMNRMFQDAPDHLHLEVIKATTA
jgi:hypothetical protein